MGEQEREGRRGDGMKESGRGRESGKRRRRGGPGKGREQKKGGEQRGRGEGGGEGGGGGERQRGARGARLPAQMHEDRRAVPVESRKPGVYGATNYVRS